MEGFKGCQKKAWAAILFAAILVLASVRSLRAQDPAPGAADLEARLEALERLVADQAKEIQKLNSQIASQPQAPQAAAMAQAPAPAPVAAPSAEAESKFQIHGFLSQAYAWTNGHQVLGIPHTSTTDYRNTALQFRYAITPSDIVVLQYGSEQMNNSPFEEEEEGVELDWAFYEHRFQHGTRLKVGRIPVPFGIFNETRDVGTVIPFYRIPTSIYQEGHLETNTIDGLVLSHTFFGSHPWTLDASLYGGGWEWGDNMFGMSPVVETAKVRDVLGGQLWLNTPVTGLRFGLGGYRATVSGGVSWAGMNREVYDWIASVDADMERFALRAEYRVGSQPKDNTNFLSYYGQAVIRLTEKFHLNLEADFADMNISVRNAMTGQSTRFKLPINRDYAAGLNYAFAPWLVLKGEYHQTKGFLIEERPVNYFVEKPMKTNYGIVSLSVSF